MKTKILTFIALTCLVITACNKDDAIIDDEQTKETFVWEGETFDVAESRKKLSLILDIDEEQLVFIPDSLAFQWKRPTTENKIYLYIKDSIRAIKSIQL